MTFPSGFLFSLCFKSEARGSRRNKQPSPVPVRLPVKKKEKPKRTSALPSHPLIVGKPFLPTVTVTLSKGGSKPPSDLLNNTHKQKKHTNEMTGQMTGRPHSEEGAQNVRAVTKRKDKDKPAQLEKACRSRSFFFSHHIPLLNFHSPSTVVAAEFGQT